MRLVILVKLYLSYSKGYISVRSLLEHSGCLVQVCSTPLQSSLRIPKSTHCRGPRLITDTERTRMKRGSKQGASNHARCMTTVEENSTKLCEKPPGRTSPLLSSKTSLPQDRPGRIQLNQYSLEVRLFIWRIEMLDLVQRLSSEKNRMPVPTGDFILLALGSCMTLRSLNFSCSQLA